MYSKLASRSVINYAAYPSRRVAVVSATRSSSTRFYSSTMHDNNPELLEQEKQRNLSNTQHKTSTPHEHAPGWNEYLATSSEASVKADSSVHVDPIELQRRTVDYLHSRHTPEDRLEPREAIWLRDEVGGPLSSAAGKNDDHPEKTILKKTVHEETTEVWKDASDPTESEEVVKADRKDN